MFFFITCDSLTARVVLLLAFIALPQFALGLNFKLYGYRSDVKVPDVQFWKLCYEKAPRTNVRLVMGDSCGVGFSDDLHSLRSVGSTARISNQKALSMVKYQRRKSKHDQTKPAILQAKKVKDTDEVIIHSGAKRIEVDSDQDPLGYIPRPVLGLGKGFSGSKVVVIRPQNMKLAKEITVNSQVEVGRSFESNTQGIYGMTPVDLSLDIIGMANPTTGDKYKLIACEMTFGDDKQGSARHRQIYLQRKAGKVPLTCFPFQLTVSPDLVHHTKDLWIQLYELLSKYKHVPFDTFPQYHLSPYKVGQIDEKSYVVYQAGKSPNALLEFERLAQPDEQGESWRVTNDYRWAYLPNYRKPEGAAEPPKVVQGTDAKNLPQSNGDEVEGVLLVQRPSLPEMIVPDLQGDYSTDEDDDFEEDGERRGRKGIWSLLDLCPFCRKRKER